MQRSEAPWWQYFLMYFAVGLGLSVGGMIYYAFIEPMVNR